MALTKKVYTATSGQASSKAFNITFDGEAGSAATSSKPYISTAHIKANVNGVANADFTVDGTVSPSTLTFGGSTTIVVDDVVEIYRETPQDLANRTVDFVKGALLTESDLDLSAVHNQFLAVEAMEGSGSVLATGSTTPRSLSARFAEVTNVLDHGATGDGSTDDTAAIQRALDAVSADGGVVFVPAGDYKITSTLQVNRPAMIRCEGWFDEATTATPSADASVTFKWAPGAPPSGVTSTMFCFSDHTPTELAAGSGLSGSRLFGCGIVGAALDGNDSLERAIWAASTVHGKFHVHVRQCTQDGLVVDGGAGALSERNEFRVDSMWGTAEGTKPMNAVRTRRYNSFASTQNRFVSVNGTLFTGDHIHLEDTDNNIIEQLHGVNAGAGYALRFANGSTNHGRNNLALYVHGDIKCESTTYGNRIMHSSSDGSKLEIDAGGHVHYEALDFTNGELWRTHSYLMSDDYHIAATAMRPDENATEATVENWRVIKFPNSTEGSGGIPASITLAPPAGWSEGTITAITFHVVHASESPGTGVVFCSQILCCKDGETITTPGSDVNITVPLPAAANTVKTLKHTFASAITYNLGDLIFLRIERKNLLVADDHPASVFLVGLVLHYAGTGPDSSTSGPYAVGPYGV